MIWKIFIHNIYNKLEKAFNCKTFHKVYVLWSYLHCFYLYLVNAHFIVACTVTSWEHQCCIHPTVDLLFLFTKIFNLTAVHWLWMLSVYISLSEVGCDLIKIVKCFHSPYMEVQLQLKGSNSSPTTTANCNTSIKVDLTLNYTGLSVQLI